MIFDRVKYKCSCHEAGGLKRDYEAKQQEFPLEIPEKFIAPRKIDSRDMCLNSNNQYKAPNCAGYAVAGYIEYVNWKTLHYPAHIDGDIIYKFAKELDNIPAEGTTLSFAFDASVRLGLIKGTPKYIRYDQVLHADLERDEKKKISIQFALHEFGVVAAGFNITDDWDWVDRKTGLIRNRKNSRSKGGHAVLLCGYDEKGVYLQNSWGENWGHYGFAILSWEQVNVQLMQAMVVEGCFCK